MRFMSGKQSVQHSKINYYNPSHWQGKRNQMIISIDAEKFWQNSTPILDKITKLNRNGGELPQLYITEELIANIILNDEKLEVSLIISEQGKDACSNQLYSTLSWNS